MLRGEGAANSGRFYRSEQKTREREGHQLVRVGPVNRWKADGWQALRHFAEQFHPAGVKAEQA